MSLDPEITATQQETSRLNELLDNVKHLVGRSALILGLATGVGVASGSGEAALETPTPAYATTTFANDYPDLDAIDCSQDFGTFSWCKGNPATPHSSRGYDYRNCTDGVAYWVNKYTGVDVRGWGNATNWDSNAPSADVMSGTTTTNIEPGDIAQSDTGAGGLGHVGFVTSITKNTDGSIKSFTTAELNRGAGGEYSTNTYDTRNASGKFNRGAGNSWDHFIDVNGPSKGLNNEDLGAGGGGGSGAYPDGTFLKINESQAIYRMVGGAPIRIYNQGALPDFNGQVTNISNAQLGQLPTYPDNGGDIINLPEAGNAKYRFVGGAPVRIYNCAALPGNCSGAISVNFQSLTTHDHMLERPKDGAVANIAEAGGSGIYEFVGGAPIRQFNWGAIPNFGPAIDINFQSLTSSDHMNAVPADGAVVSLVEAGGAGIYEFAGGAPLRLYNWGPIPGLHNAVNINAQSLANADHMNSVPVNGEFIASLETGLVYRVAGGAALRLYNQGGIPGYNGAVIVNQQTLDTHDHLLTTPSNGTILQGVTSHNYWQITDGKRSPVGASSGSVIVDEQTIADIPQV